MNYRHPLEIPRSKAVTGLRWTAARTPCPVEGIHGDTYPMTWAADGEMYMSAGDPNWILENGKPRGITWQEAFDRPELYPHMGGADVEKLTGFGANFGVEQINTMPGLMGPGGNGAKPSGMISVRGSLYLAVQNLLGKKNPPHREKCQHGSDASIIRSDDYGKTWYPDIQTGLAEMEARFYDRRGWRWTSPPEAREEWMGWRPMFPGAKFGGPSFIQFGQDSRERASRYIYAVSGDQWDNGSELRLGRVPEDEILEAGAWQFASPRPDGGVSWVERLEDSQPVLRIDGHISLPEMICLPVIGRYLLLTWALHKDFDPSAGSELTVLEAEQPWGPFRLVHYEEIWDSTPLCPYCPRIPLKWFDPGSLTGWLLHSGSWHSPEPYYKPHVRPFLLLAE